MALALFISFSILNIADLSTDGCYTLGFAVGAVVTLSGHPILAIPAAMAAGACAGFCTAFLQTRLGVESILAGIIVNTGLYTVNLAVMGWSSNLSIFGSDSLFTLFRSWSDSEFWRNWHKVILPMLVLLLVCLLVALFFRTRLGLSIRATGDNAEMVRASSINPAFTVTVGLCLSNSLTALGGCLYGLLNKACDINLGTGMVTVALASLVIGESLIGKGSIPRRICGVVVGAVLYRVIVAFAIGANIPPEGFKLVSALIVAIAIAAPQGRKLIALKRQKAAAYRKEAGNHA